MREVHYLSSENLLFVKVFEKQLNWLVSDKIRKTIISELDKIIGIDKKSDTLKIVLDLADAEYISSGFIRIICTCLLRVGADNLSIVNANKFISKIFLDCGLSRYVV